MPMRVDELEAISRRIRAKVVHMSHSAGCPHLGSALSCVDILVAAYYYALKLDPAKADAPERDRFILSKGHAAPALYAVLADRGFFPQSILDNFNTDGAVLAEQPSPGCVPGMEAATGSLGHGLSIGIGQALAARINGQKYRVFVTMSDGECNEGSVWEAALFAPAQKIDNLIAFIDYNKWQATGRSNEIMAIDPFPEKWRAFGWSVHEIDGHDMAALVKVMSSIPDGSGKPIMVICHTVKGKGVSFMQDDNNWHYRIPTYDEVCTAFGELGQSPVPAQELSAHGHGKHA
jgi:transketolase